MTVANNKYDVMIVGGGAAGFFAAIRCGEMNPKLKIAILERGNDVLNKVRISGGGRCNVTHDCQDAAELVKFYPRGQKELRGPFNSFGCGDTIDWFASRGVKLKIEPDGRMFPVTDDSETIAQCLVKAAKSAGVQVLTSIRVDRIMKESVGFKLETNAGNFNTNKLMIASGSSTSIWNELQQLGHTIIAPVPSLFTFRIQDERIASLSGISVEKACVSFKEDKNVLCMPGPILITHRGLSGPGILKLSAWGARNFYELKYRFEILINWVFPLGIEDVLAQLNEKKSGVWSKKSVDTQSPFQGIPIRLWKQFASSILGSRAGINWADLKKEELRHLAEILCMSKWQVVGKNTFKEEFVTAGGVSLKEMNLKRFESKKITGLFIAGEALDIDAVTGGFNFQAAWTGGFLAGTAMAEE